MHVNNEISYCLCLPHFIIENQRRSWGILQIRRKIFKYVYTKEGHRPPLYTLPYPSDIFQTPPRHLSEHLPGTFQTTSRHLPDTLQTPSYTLQVPTGHPRENVPTSFGCLSEIPLKCQLPSLHRSKRNHDRMGGCFTYISKPLCMCPTCKIARL